MLNAKSVFAGLMMLLLFMSGCATHTTPYEQYDALTAEAVKSLAELKVAGKLPGVTKDDKGEVQSGALPLGAQVVYPVPMELRITTEPDHEMFEYLLVKKNKSAKWRLTRALRILPDGKDEELQIP